MATYKVNPDAVAHAERLIDARQYVLTSDWGTVQPRAPEENAFLQSHSWDEYAQWHLGLTEGAAEETKARYGFVYGDFRRVHRMGLIACMYRAAEWRHKAVELAAHDLLPRLDRASGLIRDRGVPGGRVVIGRHDLSDDRGGVRGAGRAAPPRAPRPLLPHARLLRGGRGPRPGDAAARLAKARSSRTRRVVPRVALQDRDQRVPRRDQEPGAAAAVARLVPRRPVAPALSRPPAGRDRAAGGGARRRRRRAGDDRAHLPRRHPAAAATPACGVDPARRAGLVRPRDGRAARDRRGGRELGAPARAGDDPRAAPDRAPRGLGGARGERGGAGAARCLHRHARAR